MKKIYCFLLILLLVPITSSNPAATVQIQPDGSSLPSNLPLSSSSSSSSSISPSSTPLADDNDVETRFVQTTVDPNPTVDFRSDLPVFVPTNEWQEVLPGQHVPGGLHYRLDLEQNKKWAKYLPGIDGEMARERQLEQQAKDSLKGIRIVDNVGIGHKQQKHGSVPLSSPQLPSTTSAEAIKEEFKGLKYKKLTTEELELQRAELMDRVLRGLPAPPPELIGIDKEIDPEKWKEVLNLLWVKRQKLIHDASNQIHNSATAMQNATRDLMDVTTTESEKIHILTAMEREVRQIDNAQDFNTVGGLAVTASLLDDPSLEVQKMSAFVMATASRNHEVVQAAALELGVVDQLVKHLKIVYHEKLQSSEFDLRLGTASKLILALGAVVRGAEQNVKHFNSISGGRAIESLLESCQNTLQNINKMLLEDPSDNVNKRRGRKLCNLRSKIFTLATDLLEGPYDWNVSNSSVYLSSIASGVGVGETCATGPSREVSLKLLRSIQEKEIWNKKQQGEYGMKNVLISWNNEWKKEIQEDPEDEYLIELVALSTSIIEKL
jgi:hypothetical protein